MIKFVNSMVVFEEIPNEITLAVNISNCQFHCDGCHSSYLRENIGEELNFKAIDELIEKNDGITCFCFMGEGNDPELLKKDIKYIKDNYPKLKIALYSGSEKLDDDFYWDNLNYIKIGPYMKAYGPLNEKTTNQRLYSEVNINKSIKVNGHWRSHWEDITEKFWK